MSRFSTNALTRRWAQQQGYLCETVQTFYAGRRHDLFGIADSILVIPARPIIFAQNCSYGSLKAHRDAIDSEALREVKRALLSSGAILWLLEWRRRKAKRGGKRIAREWYVRCQESRFELPPLCGWSELSEWKGPYDVYPPRGQGLSKDGRVEAWTTSS